MVWGEGVAARFFIGTLAEVGGSDTVKERDALASNVTEEGRMRDGEMQSMGASVRMSECERKGTLVGKFGVERRGNEDCTARSMDTWAELPCTQRWKDAAARCPHLQLRE